jgi:hypothetical protein
VYFVLKLSRSFGTSSLLIQSSQVCPGAMNHPVLNTSEPKRKKGKIGNYRNQKEKRRKKWKRPNSPQATARGSPTPRPALHAASADPTHRGRRRPAASAASAARRYAALFPHTRGGPPSPRLPVRSLPDYLRRCRISAAERSQQAVRAETSL